MVRELAFLTALTLVVAACGAGGAPGPVATTAPAATPTEDPDKAVADFYRGKTVRIIVGFGPGGGFDTTARILARHMGKYIPGNPTVVVENMPGAGSRAAANHLYEVAEPDGLTFGTFNEQQVLQQALGEPDIQFDARDFSWLGSVFSATIVCLATAESGFTSIEETIGSATPYIVGSTGPGSNTNDFPAVLQSALGANIQIVAGYDGTSAISQAVSSGEVDGGCWTWDTMSVTQGQNIADGRVIPLVMQGDPIAELADVPIAEDVATTEQAKAIIKAITVPATISKPFAAPPGVPEERLRALREAFDQAWKDPDLLDEVEQAQLEVAPKTAEEMQEIVDELLGYDEETLAALKEAIGAE
ncbi:MAG: Bug family tripartite tricarboxylate transporter substrate binding protein [Candidatus Limnocylindria bacterium]